MLLKLLKLKGKHYYYADMPAGYQITQQKMPIGLKGLIKYPVIDPKSQKLSYNECIISRIQLELDSARSLNTEDLDLRTNDNELIAKNSTLIDLNRAGMGLMEIVTEPCFNSAFESYSFARELAIVLQSIGTCQAQMGEGGFRVDVNVSVHETDEKTGSLLPGTRVELKNLSSFSTVLKATEYEIKRQKKLVNSNDSIVKETRTFDSKTNKTISIRSKEDQYDYRFMPEPNLLPLIVYAPKSFSPSNEGFECKNNKELVYDQTYLNRTSRLKEGFYVDLDSVKEDFSTKDLPQKRRDFIILKFGLKHEIAFTFVANGLDKILNEIMKNKSDDDQSILNQLVNILSYEYLNQINSNPQFHKIDFNVRCRKIESYLELMLKGLISKKIRFKFFTKLFDDLETNAFELADKENLYIVNDPKVINEALESLMIKNQKAIEQYKTKPKKQTKLNHFFIRILHEHFKDQADSTLVIKAVNTALHKLVNC